MAVWAALAGNLLVAASKFIAAAISGSAAMLSEAVRLAPNNVIATLSLDFFDYLRAPDIERAVIELETRVRSAHPEVSAIFVKPQSVLVAAERSAEGVAAERPQRTCRYPEGHQRGSELEILHKSRGKLRRTQRRAVGELVSLAEGYEVIAERPRPSLEIRT